MITLLTDFGLRDHFVGVMKGVIASIAPRVPVVDITHEVTPFAIHEGAFLLAQSWRYFPKGTIHVAIVDPGVGSARRPLLLESRGHYFIGPDNGLFTPILANAHVKARVLDAPRYWLPEVSSTFHGRDIFAPTAAHLAAGVKPSRLGTRISDPLTSAGFEPRQLSEVVYDGLILHSDRFGNLITNFPAAEFPLVTSIEAGPHIVTHRARTYAEAPAGAPCLIAGSAGYLEISIAAGSAAAQLGLNTGAPLRLNLA